MIYKRISINKVKKIPQVIKLNEEEAVEFLKTKAKGEGTLVVRPSFEIKDLNDEQMLYELIMFTHFREIPGSYDEKGVIQYGNKYHPQIVARKGLHYLLGGQVKDSKIQADWLIENSHEEDGVMLIPYPFDFYAHGELMKSPWYSGMTQGFVLALFSRLYKATNEEKYLIAAEKVFNSLTHPKIAGVFEGHLWIFEYPGVNGFALNGFLLTIYGAYEYYQIKKDAISKGILFAILRTAKDFGERYRVKGDYSYYCLKHRVKSQKYHLIHILLYRLFYNITGDRFFKDFAEALKSDKIQ